MLAYRDVFVLDGIQLKIDLPLEFTGKKVEVIVLDNSETNNEFKEINNKNKPKFDLKPIKIGLNEPKSLENTPYDFEIEPNWVWSREDCYD